MLKTTICLIVIAALFTGCEEQTHKNNYAEFALLSENQFTLTIDRVANGPEVQFPADSLKEGDYIATNEEIQYEINFSENGQTVTIESLENETVSGHRTNDGETSRRYDLNEGLFAGGRFIIWISNGQFEAEYTIYGSGIPIVRSERGVLAGPR